MIAAYVRVSSRSQNLKTQRDAITTAARARSDGIDRWFEEKSSGAKLARTELDKVRELARVGQLKKLYIYRLDRLTRSGIRDTLGVLEELRSYGCRVASIADGFNVDGAGAEIVIAVMAWAAKMERLAIGERISAARARVERAGGKWGRPSRVPPELASKIQKAKGTVRELAIRFHVPRSTVANVLSKKGAYARTLKPAAKRPTKKR